MSYPTVSTVELARRLDCHLSLLVWLVTDGRLPAPRPRVYGERRQWDDTPDLAAAVEAYRNAGVIRGKLGRPVRVAA